MSRGLHGIKLLCEEVEKEVKRAILLHQPITTTHDGYGIIKEELDELWDSIRKTKETRSEKITDEQANHMRKEAIHIAAMAVRFIHDLSL